MRRVLRVLALSILATAMITLGFVYYFPIQDPYYPLNNGWNGCSDIVHLYANNTILAHNYDSLSAGEGSLLVIIGPTIGFDSADGANIAAFLIEGGTVLLADNFGTGNQLLLALNVNLRISDEPLADLYFYSRSPQFPFVSDFPKSQLTTNLTAILLNNPSYLIISDSRSAVLAYSSPFSFVNYDHGQPLPNETQAAYPVMAVTNIGKGMLITISDPNVFTNQMLNLFDNLRLFQNIMNGKSHLILDVSHIKTALLTPARVQALEQLNSTARFLFSSQEGVYLQWAALSVIILGFSVGISVRLRRCNLFTPLGNEFLLS